MSRVLAAHCIDSLPEKTRAAARERQRQIELAKARGEPHPLGYDQRQNGRKKEPKDVVEKA